jgi:glycosyltransferase involved in cell wall biosynthesis
MQNIYLSIVMPCLNEAKTLETCILKAKYYLSKNNILGEIIIADNGSTDGSIEIAKRNNTRLIAIQEKGHGYALSAGISAAYGKYVIIGDSDDSYDFKELSGFIEKFNADYELVIGNRFIGSIEKGAMPFLHRYFGTPLLSLLNRILFSNKIGDVHGGLRGFKKSSFEKLNIQSRDMVFCTEMIARASIKEMRLTEIPITLYRDGRNRKPHLKTWKDGWACLKYSLLLWTNKKTIVNE